MSKKALCVGINDYPNPRYSLKGCVNDVYGFSQLMEKQYGFSSNDFTFLINEAATAARIRQELSALLKNAVRGDVLVFYFAGHGTQKRSITQNEPDGLDEAIVPVELIYSSIIIDDDIAAIIDSSNLPDDGSISFTAIYDCCHSGTMDRDLEFGDNGEIIENWRNRCIDIESLHQFSNNMTAREVQIRPYTILAACKDEETAADLDINGTSRGAFSYSLQSFLNDNPSAPIKDIEEPVLNSVRKINCRLQTPQYYALDPAKPLFMPL